MAWHAIEFLAPRIAATGGRALPRGRPWA